MGLWGSYFQTMRFGGGTCQKLQVGGFKYASRIYTHIYTYLFVRLNDVWNDDSQWLTFLVYVDICLFIYICIYIYSNYITYVLGGYAETSKQIVTCALPRSRDFHSSVHPRVHLCLCISHIYFKRRQYVHLCMHVYFAVYVYSYSWIRCIIFQFVSNNVVLLFFNDARRSLWQAPTGPITTPREADRKDIGRRGNVVSKGLGVTQGMDILSTKWWFDQ